MANYTNNIDVEPDLLLGNPEPQAIELTALDVNEAGGDETPPRITFALASGTTIGRSQEIVVDIEEETLLRASVIMVLFASQGAYEVAWDSSGFAPMYSDSQRTPLVDGYRYRLRRNGGWYATPTVRALAVDGGGNAEVEG